MADRIAVMSEGRLQQVGPPQAVYDRPHNLFVARFIGSPPMNTVPGTVVRTASRHRRASSGGQTIDVEPATTEPLAEGTSVVIGVRPEHLVVDPDGQAKAEVRAVEWLGHERLVICDLAGDQITVRQSSGDEPVSPGDVLPALRRRRPRAPVRPGHDGAAQLSRRLKDSLFGLALLVPSAIIFAWFFFYPLYRLFVLGLHQQNRTGTAERWVGFSQYSRRAHRPPVHRRAADHLHLRALHRADRPGARRAAGRGRQPPAEGHQGLPGHLLLHHRQLGGGRVGGLLRAVQPPDRLLRVDRLLQPGPIPAPPSRGVALSSVWQNLGLTFVIVLAGLQAVPEEVHEAATLDGYGPVRRFFRVTLPLISPTLMFLAVVLVIFALQAFAQVDILTQGGPLGSTETLVFKIFNSQQPLDQGTGAVMAIGLFGITLVVTLAPVPAPRSAGPLWELT